LQQYNFDVLYRPGKQNFAADCLSRYNEAEETSTNEADPVETSDDAVEIDTVFGSTSSPVVDLTELSTSVGIVLLECSSYWEYLLLIKT